MKTRSSVSVPAIQAASPTSFKIQPTPQALWAFHHWILDQGFRSFPPRIEDVIQKSFWAIYSQSDSATSVCVTINGLIIPRCGDNSLPPIHTVLTELAKGAR